MNVRKFCSNHIQNFFNLLVGFQALFAVFDDLIRKFKRQSVQVTTEYFHNKNKTKDRCDY